MVIFIQAIAIMAMGICALFVAGLPIADLVLSNQLSEKKDSCIKDSKWALAPFMGFGIVVPVLKLFVAIGVPVMYSAWPLFLLSITAFVIYLLKKYKGGSLGEFFPSKQFVILFFAIMVLAGFAYFASNPVYYRGYNADDTWADTHMMEMFRTIPMARFSESLDRYVWGTMHFISSMRMSVSVLGAFVATISFVDSASVYGFMSILSVLQVYCSLVFATKDIEIKPYYRWAACFFGAMLPAVIMGQLEGFLTMALFTSIMIVFAKLSIDVYNEPDWFKTIAFGFFISAAITTLLDSIYLLVAINLLLLLVFLIGKGAKLKLLLHAIVLTGVAVVFNLPFLDMIIESQLSSGMSMARISLNGAVPSAYSKDMYNRLIMGSVFENTNEIIVMVISILSFFIVICGIYALIELLVQKRRLEGLAFIPIVLSPLFFYGRSDDYTYAIYKIVQMGSPLIVLGIWLFWESCQKELQTSLLFHGKDKLNKFFSAFTLKGGTALLTAIFIYTSCVSVSHSAYVLNPWNLPLHDHYTAIWVDSFRVGESDYLRKIYDKLRANRNVEYLFVTGDFENKFIRWMNYYARGNPVYYLNGYENGRLSINDLSELPMDVIIFDGLFSTNIVSDAQLHEDFAAVMRYNTKDGLVTIDEGRLYLPPTPSNSFQFNIFARGAVPATLRLYPTKDTIKGITLSYDGNTYSIDSSGEVVIPLNLQAGGQELTVTTQNGDIAFEQFYLDINLLSPSNK